MSPSCWHVTPNMWVSHLPHSLGPLGQRTRNHTSCRSSSADMLLWNGWKVGTGPFSGSWEGCRDLLQRESRRQPNRATEGFLFPHPLLGFLSTLSSPLIPLCISYLIMYFS